MTTREEIIPNNVVTSPWDTGGELLQHAQEQETSPEVTSEVDNTAVAVIGGLWKTFIPAQEIEKLMEMRAENDNTDTEKEAA